MRLFLQRRSSQNSIVCAPHHLLHHFFALPLLLLLILDNRSDVFFVIRAHSTPEGAFYQLEIATLDGVPTFGPALSTSYNPSNNFQFRELLFTKSTQRRLSSIHSNFFAAVINAERAVYETPALMRRIIRTRFVLCFT